MPIKLKLRLALLAIFLFMLVLFAARLTMYLLIDGGEYFANLSVNQVLFSFVNGLRFDFYVVMHTVGMFLFFFLLPINNKVYQKVILSICVLLFVVISIYTAGDIIFFNYFHKHITTEFVTSLTHFGWFVSEAFRSYLPVTLTIFVIAFISLFIINIYVNRANKSNFSRDPIYLTVLVVLIFGFAIFAGLRGFRTHGKSLRIADATKYYTDVEAGNLTLNGIFSTYESTRLMVEPRSTFYLPHDESIAIATQNTISINEEVLDPEYPLIRIRKNFSLDNTKGANVVLILLESWGRDYIDSYAGTSYGVTPNFDDMVNNGVLYKNFYSEGRRSLMGLTGTFLSLPYIDGLPFMNRGLEMFDIPKIGKVLSDEGYKTYFVQTDLKRSDKADEIAAFMGFSEFYSNEDIPVEREYPFFYKGYDYESFEFFFDKIKDANEPFFGVFYSASTHSPYDVSLTKEHEKYPPTNNENRYLNRLYYADASLGNFMSKARQEEWFDDTIFIVLGDHRAIGTPEGSPIETKFGIFMNIYAPKYFEQAVVTQPFSQMDVNPTIIDMLHIQRPYASLGSSVFDSSVQKPVVVFGEDGNIYADNGLEQVMIERSKAGELPDGSLKKTAVAIDEAIYFLMKNNKYYDHRKD